jgi:hypothetical protein
MKRSGVRPGLLALGAFLATGLCNSSRADLVDNFNGENGGVGLLNYTTFANWSVTQGSVDLIGNGFFDFYPGNGLFVDLNGSTGVSGTLTSKATFTPGTYTLSFDVGNNPSNASPDTMTVSLGSFSHTFTETGTVSLQHFSTQVTLTSPSALVFATPASDNDDIGVVIDNVSLISVAAAPEPSTLMTVALGAFGFIAYGLRCSKRRESVEAVPLVVEM